MGCAADKAVGEDCSGGAGLVGLQGRRREAHRGEFGGEFGRAVGREFAMQRAQRDLDLSLRQEALDYDGIAGGGPVEQFARDLARLGVERPCVSRGGLGDRSGGGQTDRGSPQVADAALELNEVTPRGRPN